MQPIHRTSYQGLQPFPALRLAEHLAALIDGQTQTNGAAAKQPGNALIWVEGEPGLAAGHGRGMIVAGHGPDPAAAKRSSMISYSLGDGDGRQCLHTMSSALEMLGWSVLALRRRTTATGCANMAVLINHARSGNERLMLAEPIQAARQQPARPMPRRRGRVVPPARLRRSLGASVAARTTHDQLGMSESEGGAWVGATR